MQRIEDMRKLSELRELRKSSFGPGQAGRKAFRMIVMGNPCETIVNDAADNNRCGKAAIMTVDFRIPILCEPFEQILICGISHAALVVERVKSDLPGRKVEFSFNGWGRS